MYRPANSRTSSSVSSRPTVSGATVSETAIRAISSPDTAASNCPTESRPGVHCVVETLEHQLACVIDRFAGFQRRAHDLRVVADARPRERPGARAMPRGRWQIPPQVAHRRFPRLRRPRRLRRRSIRARASSRRGSTRPCSRSSGTGWLGTRCARGAISPILMRSGPTRTASSPATARIRSMAAARPSAGAERTVSVLRLCIVSNAYYPYTGSFDHWRRRMMHRLIHNLLHTKKTRYGSPLKNVG